MYKLEYYEGLPKEYEDTIFNILCEANEEFVPPLSSRNSSKQKDLKNNIKKDQQPTAYFNNIKKQSFIIIKKEHDVVGFMTFIYDYVIDDVEMYSPSTYVTTVVVKPNHRGLGLTYLLYEKLFTEMKNKDIKKITTRTWSTNSSHIHILEEKGFKVIKKIINDRGENIHTLYFGRNL